MASRPSTAAESSKLDEIVRSFLSSKEGNAYLDSRTGPRIGGLIKSGILAFLGFVMTSTIFLIWPGIKWLWQGLTLAPLRDYPSARLRANLGNVRGLLCYPIMSGPGEPLKPSLLVANVGNQFDPSIVEFAQHCFQLYADMIEPETDEKSLTMLLKDDTFHENRQREVPKEAAPGPGFWLFDAMIDLNEVSAKGFMICAVIPGKKGALVQLPLSVIGRLAA